MNIHATTRDAERAQSEGDAVYEQLLPILQRQGVKAGHFVAISIATGEFVTAETRLELMTVYKEKFGESIGWVRRIEYESH
ncbi:MAG: hypothetical protein QOI12_813 [Alphaproteobacteria bacterium]|jgi:hypothetical protein|nr:hypothetical protein [Alphaproteobacteria bacterium]